MTGINGEIQGLVSIKKFLEILSKIRLKLAQKLLSLGFSSIMKVKIYMEVITMTAYKKGWLRASIAGGITSLLTLFLYLSGQPYQVNKSTFLTGLIVAIILVTAPIYDDNRLSLKQQSLLHFSFMCVTILPILCLSGWYPLHNVVDFLKILASFLTCGLVLWSLAYLIFGKLLHK